MAWITVIWSMIAAICLTLAVTHGMTWVRHRQQRVYLMFATLAVSVAALALFELAMMKAADPFGYGQLLRWAHVPIALLFLSLVCFVRLYLRAGRLWLAGAVLGLRGSALVLNFLADVNLHYTSIANLKQVRLFGESISVVG